jgi:tetratricopeptide (TPR) repeat protein
MSRLPALALLLLLAAPAAAGAETPSILQDPLFRDQARLGLEYMYGMDFGAADGVFGQLVERYPDHPVGPYLQTLLPWWGVQLEPDDPSQDQRVLAGMERVIEICERRLDADPADLDAQFFKAGAHALRGRLHADRRRWLKSARDGQQALRLLQEVVAREPEIDDLYWGLGLFNYLADVVPQQHRILRPFARLFPKGDKERGIAELERAMEKGQFVSTEAAYSLLQLHYYFDKDYTASLRYAQWLRAKHPENSIFHLFEGRIHERLGRLPEAKRALEEVRARHATGQSGYTDALAERALYLLARVEMRQRRHDEALACLDQLERLTASRTVLSEYKALGRLRRGMIFDSLGRRQEAVRCYRDVLAMQRGYLGDDDVRSRAKGYLKKPYAS